MDYQGFKHRKEECEELARELRTEGYGQAEMEDEDEMEIFLKELELNGIYRVEDLDEDMEALDSDEEPLFHTRLFFTDQQDVFFSELEDDKIWPVDFFYCGADAEFFFGDEEFF